MPSAADATTGARTDLVATSQKRRRSGSGRKRSTQRAKRFILPLLVLVVLALLAMAWLGFRALQAKDNLEASARLLPTLQSEISDGNVDGAAATLHQLQDHTAEARRAGTDPLWRAASLTPWLGHNFSAVTDITVAADVVVDAAAPLMDSIRSGGLNQFVPENGKLELGPVQELAPKLSRAAGTVNAAYNTLAQIDADRLLPQLSDPLIQATEALGNVRGSLKGASDAAEILPAMLGVDGGRNYLVLVQNSAEVRATGGIPGALVVLRTNDGQIELADQGSASELGRFKPALEVDEEQERIYTDRLGGFMQNVNLTPDFPTAAETAQRMWEQEKPETKIDGVIAIDTIVLSQLLAATGPVELTLSGAFPAETGNLPTTLTSENVVKTLLSDVYREIESPAVQDAYFAAVAGDIFSALTGGNADPAQLVQALRESSDAGRLFVWSEIEDEQKTITASALGGSITTTSPTIGVYFNDGTGAKMDYYVKREVRVTERCQPDGYYRYAVETKLTNTAPEDAAASLPDYVTGGGAFGVEPGTVRTNVYAYGPKDWLLDSATINGESAAFGSYHHDGHPVGAVTVSLKPGESATVEFEVVTPFETDEPRLRITPTIQSIADVTESSDASSSCESKR